MQGNLLKAKVYEKGYKMKDLKKVLKKSDYSIFKKLKGTTPFNNKEIKAIKDFLNLCDEDVTSIFLS